MALLLVLAACTDEDPSPGEEPIPRESDPLVQLSGATLDELIDDFEPIDGLDLVRWAPFGANASVSIAGAKTEFGTAAAECSAIASGDGSVVFISTFPGEGASTFAYTDRGDESAIWGLSVGDEEWSGAQGRPTLLGGAITFWREPQEDGSLKPVVGDPAEEPSGVEDFGQYFLIRADWSGEATENFSGDKRAAEISVWCSWINVAE